MIRLDEAIGCAAAGSKAETLARARAAGLPVLDGFVVLPDEEVDEAELARELARLDGAGDGRGIVGRFAVRSSASVEDRPGLSAAGVFETVLDVTRGEVAAAIERVRASAWSGAARAYLAARGGETKAAMAVLVQPMARSARLGVLHTAPLERVGDEETMAAEERDAGAPEWGEVEVRRVAMESALGRDALRLATLLGRDADVEYALDGGTPIFLQARPLTTTTMRDATLWDPGDEAIWAQDAEHNPLPLSAAQASLVELLNETPTLPRQLVLHGYLYAQRREFVEAEQNVVQLDELPAWFAQTIEPACEALLAPLEAQPEPPLDEALMAYVAVSRLYYEQVSPSLRAARRALDELLRRSVGELLSAHGALLAGTGGRTAERDAALHELGVAWQQRRDEARLADYLRRFGAYAPAWDVIEPPDDEARERVLASASLLARAAPPGARLGEVLASAAAAARRVGARMPCEERRRFDELLPSVRATLRVAEDDDALFFRAQRLVRRALLTRGQRLVAAGRLDEAEDVLELPLSEVRADRIDKERVVANRALREKQRGLTPPSTIRDRRPSWRGDSETDRDVLRGVGTAGRGHGRAWIVRDATEVTSVPRGAVLVMDAVLPSLTWLLPGAAGLVTDVGGSLSHAATLAREYGVPAVLGTGSATRALRDGDELIVDGDGGRVFRLGR